MTNKTTEERYYQEFPNAKHPFVEGILGNRILSFIEQEKALAVEEERERFAERLRMLIPMIENKRLNRALEEMSNLLTSLSSQKELKKQTEIMKIKQIERFDYLGEVYLIAVSEGGDLYQNKIGSNDWTIYPTLLSQPKEETK